MPVCKAHSPARASQMLQSYVVARGFLEHARGKVAVDLIAKFLIIISNSKMMP